MLLRSTKSGEADAGKPTLTNRSGSPTAKGEVFLIDPSNNNSVIYSTDDRKSKVAVALSVVANLASGKMVTGGVVDVYINAGGSIGDYLYFSTTNGQAKPVSGIPQTGNFGFLIESTFGAGLAKAMIRSTAIGSLTASGSAFPSSPFTGERFRLQLSNRDITYEYNGTVWVSKELNRVGIGGDPNVFYVDSTDGTDSAEKGFGVDSDAFATLQYAVDQIPGIVGGSVIININNESYTEEVIIKGKNFTGSYYILVQGAVSTLVSEVQATSGSSTTITKSGAGWTVNAYQGKMVRLTQGKGSTNSKLAIIISNTSDTLTIAGYWYWADESLVGTPDKDNPDSTTYFVVEDWGTTITGTTNKTAIRVTSGQNNVELKHLKLIPGGQQYYTALYDKYASGQIFGCYSDGNNAGRGIKVESFANVNVISCYAKDSNQVGAVYVNTKAECNFFTSWIYSNSTKGVYYERTAQGYIIACVIESNSSHGVHVAGNSQVYFAYWTPARDQTTIKNNGGWGCLVDTAGVGQNASTPSYSGNSSGTYSPSGASDPAYAT